MFEIALKILQSFMSELLVALKLLYCRLILNHDRLGQLPINLRTCSF